MSTTINIPIRTDRKTYPSNDTIRKYAKLLAEELVESIYGKCIIKYEINRKQPLFKINIWFYDNTTIQINTKCPSHLRLKNTEAYTLLQNMLDHLQQQGLIFGDPTDFFDVHIKKDELCINLCDHKSHIEKSIELSFDKNHSLEFIVEELITYQHNYNHEQFAYCFINDIMLCSSGLTLDKAYHLITGMSKEEYEAHWEKEKALNRMINGFTKNN